MVFPSHHAQENFSFVLQEVPISPAMLSDFHDPGDVQRLPFSLGDPERQEVHRCGLVTENVGLIFPMIASHLKTGLSDQQNHWVQWGLAYFQTHPCHCTTS